MTAFFTADTHFGHDKIRHLAPRPFDSLDEMDEALIANWNDTVARGDEVWVLGDYAMGDRARGLSYLSRLNGTKYLVQGNHDRGSAAMSNGHKHQRQYFEAGFEAVFDHAEIKLPPLTKQGPGLSVMLSHYPYSGEHGDLSDRYAQLRLRDLGRPLVHGHVHDEWTTRFSDCGTAMVNVGVERWGYRPVSASHIHRLFAQMDNGADETGR